MRRQLNALKIKGAVLAIDRGQVLLDYATSNAADTSYLINSVQKSMTAAMVMKLAQDGRLRLGDRLSRFYPEIPGAEKIKIRRLLTMTAGLDLKEGAKLGRRHFVSDEDSIERDAAKTVFKPEMLGHWFYSSLNYIYLCGIMSKVTGKSYEQLFREMYVKPLHLKRTEFLWSPEAKLIGSGLVTGKTYEDGHYNAVKHSTALRHVRNELGAGSVVMSNHDLAKTMRYILAGSMLSKASKRFLYQAGPPAYYSGGFYMNRELKTKKANGAGEGYYTFVRTTDDGQTMLIVQSNETRPGGFDELKSGIDEIMLKLLGAKASSENTSL